MRECGASGACVVANVGKCGKWSFTDEVRGFKATTRYFDAQGGLVVTCSGNIEHGGGTCQGERPACTILIEHQYGSAR
jgi:hypothetical protein